MPILDTPRLTLREFTTDDAGFIVELLNDPGWLRYIGDRGVRTEADARAWIDERLVGSYRRHGYGLWAMQRRTDGALLGMCGLVRRDSLPDPDVGYALMSHARGHGLAREAAAACLQYASRHLGLGRVLAITRPDNESSVATLRAIGMRLRERRTLDGDDHESLVFEWHAGGGRADPERRSRQTARPRSG